MLQAIRDRATGWIAYGIVGLLVIPFAFWGIDQYQGGGTVVVAEVEGSDITLSDFQTAFQDQQARMQALFGGQFDPAMLDQDRMRRDVLQQLVDQRLIDEVSNKEGYRASDGQVAAAVYAVPAFQSNGRFDPERYRDTVTRQGSSVEGFEERVRADLTAQQFRDGVVGSFVPTQSAVDLLLSLQEQQRAVGFVRLALDRYMDQIEVSADEVVTWYEANREQFVSNERVRLQYVLLSVDTLSEEVSLPDGAVEAAYQERRDQYIREETREASHVLIRLDLDADEDAVVASLARIEDIHAKMQSGELDFDAAMELAAVEGETELEAGDLGEVSRGMLGLAFEDALFAMDTVGSISDPVRSDFGFHLIRLDQINPERGKTLDEAAAELEQALKTEEADNLFYERAEDLANLAFEAPGSLEPVADGLGLELQDSDWLERTGGDGIWANPGVIEAAFSPEVLEDGVNSPAIEVSPTELLVIRSLEYEPSASLPLEQVREAATEGLKRERALAVIAEQSAGLLDQARSGAELAELASAEEAEWSSPVPVGRSDTALDGTILREAFRLPRPADGAASFGSIELPGGDRAVVMVAAVIAGSPDAVEDETREQVIAMLRRQGAAAEYDGIMRALRENADIKLFPDRL